MRHVLIALAVAAGMAVAAQGLDRPVVIIGTPGSDANTWKVLHDLKRPVNSMETLRRAFPDDRWLLIADNPQWYVLVDRSHQSLRLHASRDAILREFLKKADKYGVVRWGDLSKDVQDACVYMLSTAGWTIKLLGDSAKDVRLAVEPSLWYDVKASDRTISVRGGIEDPSVTSGRMQELLSGAVPGMEIPSKKLQEMISAGNEDFKELYGLAVRYIGVNPFATNKATRAGLDIFDEYLRKQQEGMANVYQDMESHFILPNATQFASGVPTRDLSKSELPPQVWSYLQSALADKFGPNDVSGLEEFVDDIMSIRVKSVYTLSYVQLGYTDSTGHTHSQASHAVELVRR